MSNIATDNPTNFLTEQEVAEIESEISHLPNRPSAAIDALKIVQSYRGWISDESLNAIAELTAAAAHIEPGFVPLHFRTCNRSH